MVLTSDLAIGIGVPRRMKTPRSARKVNDWQPRTLETAPVQTVIFVVVPVASTRHFDLRDVPLDADQSDSYESKRISQ